MKQSLPSSFVLTLGHLTLMDHGFSVHNISKMIYDYYFPVMCDCACACVRERMERVECFDIPFDVFFCGNEENILPLCL